MYYSCLIVAHLTHSTSFIIQQCMNLRLSICPHAWSAIFRLKKRKKIMILKAFVIIVVLSPRLILFFIYSFNQLTSKQTSSSACFLCLGYALGNDWYCQLVVNQLLNVLLGSLFGRRYLYLEFIMFIWLNPISDTL